MSEKGRNRGKHPSDDKLFGKKWKPIFKEAIDDLSFLLTRGYGPKSSLQLVGNRYRLSTRQQKALSRISESESSIQLRKSKEIPHTKLANQTVAIDGFNILILLESALSGGFVFKARDGNYRDISSVHGSYKRVVKTTEAIQIIGDTLQELNIAKAHWYLDAPISNSGRLKVLLHEIATAHNYPWEVTLVNNPDRELAEQQLPETIIVSSDGWVLDHAHQWFNLGAYIIENNLENKLEKLNIFSV